MYFGVCTNTAVEGEGRLVSIYGAHPRVGLNSGGEAGFQPMGMRFECNGGRSAVFTKHAPSPAQSLHISYIVKIWFDDYHSAKIIDLDSNLHSSAFF